MGKINLNNMSKEEGEKENTFSIIMPTCERPNGTKRAIVSVVNQLYQNWELIVVEDGSQESVKKDLDKFVKSLKDKRIKLIHHKERYQRLIARNTGMKKAKNEYIAHLDSDDEYLRTYLNSMNWAINEYPEYKVFNFGAIVCGLRGYRVREPHDFKEENEFCEATERFRSGLIGMGSYVYKRTIHDDIGYFPEAGVPYNFASVAKQEFPEMIEWFGPDDKEDPECKTLGNPCGDDYYLFYKITRKYKSKMLPFLTYVQFVRRSGFALQDNDIILNRPNVVIPPVKK